MSNRLCITFLAAVVLVAISACSDPVETQRAIQRTALQSQLQQAESARNNSGQLLAAEVQKVDDLNQEFAQARSGRAAYEHAVQAYMLDHKMAVAALAAGAAGGTAALDESGRFTEEARQIGTAVGLLALGWALLNMDETLQVAAELSKAEATFQDMARKEDMLGLALRQEHVSLQAAQAAYEQLGQQAAQVRAHLAAV